MKKIILYSLSCLVLGACASMIDSQTVQMTVKTPGAENAKCYLENQDHKYVIHTDETIEVMKSPHDLVVRCLAPGNREKTVLVKREINEWVVANVANGFVPGVSYDYFSRGAFDYPETITVSFTGQAVSPYPLPAYESDDLYNGNHKGKIPYQGPTTIVTEKDRYDSPPTLEKKIDEFSDSSHFKDTAPSFTSYSTSRPAVSHDPTKEDK